MTLRYVNCSTCLAIRRDRRNGTAWRESTYWKPYLDVVPDEVLMNADMEELHALHHEPDAYAGRALIFVGFGVILAHYQGIDTVPRQEMTNRLNEQFARHHAEIDAEKAKVRQEIKDHHGREVLEYRMRIAHVETLVSQAFRAKHKTMRSDDVRAAIDWRTGDKIPEATRAEQARIASLRQER